MPSKRPHVFVGSAKESIKIAEAIQENLKHDAFCVPWTQGLFGLSKTTLKSLLDELERAEFAVFVFSPVDLTKIRDETYSVARESKASY